MKLQFPEGLSCGRITYPRRFIFPPLFCIILVLASIARSHRWIDPCGLKGHVFNESDVESYNPNEIPLGEIIRNIQDSAYINYVKALNVSTRYLYRYFPDPDFATGVEHLRNRWLPPIPEQIIEVYRTFDEKTGMVKAFTLLQFFAVGIEQVIWDQKVYKEDFLVEITDLERNLIQLLCEIQVGMYLLQVEPDQDVLRGVMSHEYRNLTYATKRHLRDHLLLRDYASASGFIYEFFKYVQRCDI